MPERDTRVTLDWKKGTDHEQWLTIRMMYPRMQWIPFHLTSVDEEQVTHTAAQL